MIYYLMQDICMILQKCFSIKHSDLHTLIPNTKCEVVFCACLASYVPTMEYWLMCLSKAVPHMAYTDMNLYERSNDNTLY